MNQDERSAAEAEPKGKAAAEGEPPDRRSGQVRIRLPNGEHAWVSADAFNLISEKEFRDSDRLRRLRWQRNMTLAVALAAMLIAAAGLVILASRHPGRAVAADGSGEPAGGGGETAGTTGVATAAGLTAGETPSALSPPADAGAEIAETVRAWARAWSARDVDRYLDFYSQRFRPEDGASRSVWEGLRRQRIERPETIAIAVSGVETARIGERSAVARFAQRYRSPGYQDWVFKTLELTLEADRWRIVAERSLLIEADRGVPGAGELELVRLEADHPPELADP